MSSDPTREQGIDFGDLDEKLRTVDYPVSTETLRRMHGDHELDLVDGSTTLGDALETLDETTFSSADGVVRAVKTVVGTDAVGREGYTDRGSDAGPDGFGDRSF
jgi:hypothetical protein